MKKFFLSRRNLAWTLVGTLAVLFGGATVAHAKLQSHPSDAPMPGTHLMESSQVWYPQGSPQGAKGDLWEKGASALELVRKNRGIQVLSPQVLSQSVGPQEPLEEGPVFAEDYKRNPEEQDGITLADGAIQGDAETVGSTWRAPANDSMVIDEDIHTEQHDVVGAYAHMVQQEDFNLTMGPELYIPEEGSSTLQRSKGAENSEIGMSMRFRWGF